MPEEEVKALRAEMVISRDVADAAQKKRAKGKEDRAKAAADEEAKNEKEAAEDKADREKAHIDAMKSNAEKGAK